MGIKLINKFASAALMLSFCGAVSFSAYAQDFNEKQAVLKNNAPLIKTSNPFDKAEEKKDSALKPASKDLTPYVAKKDWTGWYAGGYLGSTHTRADANVSTVFSSTGYFAQSSVNAINSVGPTRVKGKDFAYGAQGGYNYQTGNYLIGFEADFGSNRSRQSSITSTVYPCCSPSTFNIGQTVETSWLFTARPRAGYVYKNLLVYGTAGLALTDIEYAGVFSDGFSSALEADFFKKTRVGWTAGGGLEYKIAKRWSAKGEYLFSDFGRISETSTGLNSGSTSYPQNIFTHSTYLKQHGLRFGVNFHF